MLPPASVKFSDWAVVALLGATLVFCAGGALLIVPWTSGSREKSITKEFNFLWVTRLTIQVLGALTAVASTLRLQVLWGAGSVFLPDGQLAGEFCRGYIGLALGVLQPLFLLTALFSCLSLLSSHEGSTYPNLSILVFSVCFTFPACVAQVVAAVFTQIVKDTELERSLYDTFFMPYHFGNSWQCGEDVGSGCKLCVFPLFSTSISGFFSLFYLVCLWRVAGKLSRVAINRTLAMRTQVLRSSVTLLTTLNVVSRGFTVWFEPYDAMFEFLRLVCCISEVGTIGCVCYLLVLRPVYDAYRAQLRVKAAQLTGTQPRDYYTTELDPLVPGLSDQ